MTWQQAYDTVDALTWLMADLAFDQAPQPALTWYELQLAAAEQVFAEAYDQDA